MLVESKYDLGYYGDGSDFKLQLSHIQHPKITIYSEYDKNKIIASVKNIIMNDEIANKLFANVNTRIDDYILLESDKDIILVLYVDIHIGEILVEDYELVLCNYNYISDDEQMP